MEITNNGWIKWQKTGESITIDLKGFYYNKNGNPYAVATLKNRTNDEINTNIKFNVSKFHTKLKNGRYTVKCTQIKNGLGYIDFQQLQDSSWDIHDKVG